MNLAPGLVVSGAFFVARIPVTGTGRLLPPFCDCQGLRATALSHKPSIGKPTMPALISTNVTGTIVWLGRVPDRDESLRSSAVSAIDSTFAGPHGEDHGGLTRASCSRVSVQYPLATEVRNTRQFSIVSAEEMQEIATAMGISKLDPALIGASMVISGMADFSHIPPSSRLQTRRGTTLTVDLQNRPCNLPVKTIDLVAPGKGRGFKQAAVGKRGVTAWVEREGTIEVGETITLHIPDQRPWQGA